MFNEVVLRNRGWSRQCGQRVWGHSPDGQRDWRPPGSSTQVQDARGLDATTCAEARLLASRLVSRGEQSQSHASSGFDAPTGSAGTASKLVSMDVVSRLERVKVVRTGKRCNTTCLKARCYSLDRCSRAHLRMSAACDGSETESATQPHLAPRRGVPAVT